VRKGLQIAAIVLLLGALGFWVATGANRGWTKNSVPVKILDEVTGLEGVTYQKRFVPGVDFLAVAVAGGVVLAGASFLFRAKKTGQQASPPVQERDP
jgi:hypothetical protein